MENLRAEAAPAAERGSRPGLSVRARIVASILVATALGLAGSGVAAFLVQGQHVRSSVDDTLLRTVPELRAIADGSATGSAPSSVEELLRTAMQQLIPAANEGVVGFIDGAPALVPAATLPFSIHENAALVDRLVEEAHPSQVVIGTAPTSAGALRYLIIPVRVEGDTTEGLYVSAINLDAELAGVADSFRIYAIAAGIALVLVGGVAWLVAGRLLRPIRLLKNAAASSSTMADLTRRVPVSGRDDVSQLAEAINSMFDRLQDSSLSQRRLLDDVGHELKTPLTIIRGHLELLDSANVADIDSTKLLAIEELDRMSTLVSEISLLAESSSNQFIDASELDLATFTSTVAAKAGALDPNRDWQVVAADGIAAFDPRRITQAWLQLAENAAKYSTAGGGITLRSGIVSREEESWLEFAVHDAGPGVSEAERGRIFERFQRADTSRETEGSGLGLAIVRAIAHAHGGFVMLHDQPDGGCVFTIRIPLVDAPTTGEHSTGAKP